MATQDDVCCVSGGSCIHPNLQILVHSTTEVQALLRRSSLFTLPLHDRLNWRKSWSS